MSAEQKIVTEENKVENSDCSCSSEACSSCSFGDGRSPLQALHDVANNDPLTQIFRSVIMWENKPRSAALFIASNTFFIMTVKYNFSVLSLIAYFVAISILIGFIFSYGTRCFYKYVKNSEEEIDPFAYSVFLFSNIDFFLCFFVFPFFPSLFPFSFF
jgi:hypothetical protein